MGTVVSINRSCLKRAREPVGRLWHPFLFWSSVVMTLFVVVTVSLSLAANVFGISSTTRFVVDLLALVSVVGLVKIILGNLLFMAMIQDESAAPRGGGPFKPPPVPRSYPIPIKYPRVAAIGRRRVRRRRSLSAADPSTVTAGSKP